MQAKPSEQHEWLQQFVGSWEFEVECATGEDQQAEKSLGIEVVRSLGELWILAEAQMTTPQGEPMLSVMTLGYDPSAQQFVGSFISSGMSHFWTYKGNLDPAQKVLTLDAEGPNFCEGEVTTALYKDAITSCSDTERTLTSRVLGEDGNWQQFMTARYRRVL